MVDGHPMPLTERLDQALRQHLVRTGREADFLLLPAREARALLLEWEPIMGIHFLPMPPKLSSMSDAYIATHFAAGRQHYRGHPVYLGTAWGAGIHLDD